MKTRNTANDGGFTLRPWKLTALATALVLLAGLSSAFATVRYVDVNSTNATPPYTNWAAASTNIQLAVDVAVAGDEVVVMDGVYTNGGRAVGTNLLVNRVAVDKALTLRSVNGPQFTMIQGYQLPGTILGDGAIRCAYLANGASLSGFTLTNGATRWSGPGGTPADFVGGGVWCESIAATVSNCVLAGNASCTVGGGANSGTLNSCLLSSNNTGGLPGGGYGAGAAYTTLNHCTLVGNWANYNAGAADWCVLNNCTLRSNRGNFGCDGARDSTLNNCVLSDHPFFGAENSTLNNCVLSNHVYVGAESCTLNNCTLVSNYCGASDSTLHNCIAYYNSGYNHWSSTLNYCCTTPLPPGVGNFTAAPLFVNYADGNLRLQSNSPCINAGNNAYARGPTDLDGLPRLVGGTVDMGAYECQSPALLDYFNWLQGYGLPTTAAAVYADSDSDGLNNWQEWRADTNPTNALSALRMVTVTNGTPGLQVTWQSVPTRTYWLDRATNLASPPSFSSIASNLAGQAGTTSYADTNAIGPGPFFYRVGVGQ